MFQSNNYQTYHSGLRAFAGFVLVSPVLLIIDAPHGRFSVSDKPSRSIIKRIWSAFSIDGTIAWILMELPSPLSLLYAFSQQYGIYTLTPSSLTPYTLLPLLFLSHYVNRAIISPLRTPSRSNSHIIVLLAAICFNLLNGSLTGTWLGAGARTGKARWDTAPMSFYAGLAMFGLGLWGNIWHDEVLLKLRQPKEREPESTPRYAIPYGGLYSLVSFPNYLCEWFEWAGFSLAASSIITPLQQDLTVGQYLGILVTPPVLFTLVEIAIMLPRALRGHKWYHEKFEDYPRDRKAVIPFLL